MSDLQRSDVARPERSSTTSRNVIGGLLALVVIAATVSIAIVLRSAPTIPSSHATSAMSFHVVYRVTSGSLVNTEQLWVHRPFESNEQTFSGAQVRGAPISTVITRLGRQYARNAGGSPSILEVAPSSASPDLHLSAVAADAIRSGALQQRADMHVAGRLCRVYRSLSRLSASALAAPPRPDDHVDSCVDEFGIVLDEKVVASRKILEERRAILVDDAKGTYVTTGQHVPFARGGGRIVTVTNDSRPPGVRFWNLAKTPDGFEHVGRFAVVPPQPQFESSIVPSLTTEIADVYVRGPDVITIEQGQTQRGTAFSSGTDVAVGALGGGRLLLSARSSSILVQSTRSSFVRIAGTISPRELQALAASLESRPGSKLVTTKNIATDGTT